MALTSLELAEKIARAVLHAAMSGDGKAYGNAPALAVLETLHDTSHWFTRVTETEHGSLLDVLDRAEQPSLLDVGADVPNGGAC
jgi:hypothetical protein